MHVGLTHRRALLRGSVRGLDDLPFLAFVYLTMA